VYAPIEKEYAFHRTLFVFMCLSMSCLRRDQHEQWKRHPEKPSRRYFPLFLSFVLTSKQCHFLVEIKVLTHKKITFSHSLHLHCLSRYGL
jgi:hypothetical protein